MRYPSVGCRPVSLVYLSSESDGTLSDAHCRVKSISRMIKISTRPVLHLRIQHKPIITNKHEIHTNETASKILLTEIEAVGEEGFFQWCGYSDGVNDDVDDDDVE